MPDPSELFTNVYVKGFGVEVSGNAMLPMRFKMNSLDATSVFFDAISILLSLPMQLHNRAYFVALSLHAFRCCCLQAFGADRKEVKAILP